jgi:dienelactone hydrolase
MGRVQTERKAEAMTDVILFHHAQGLTEGVRAFADQLRLAGHSVITPDLYGGATFETLDKGVAHAQLIGFAEIIALGVAAAADLDPSTTVYAGFSLGVLPAQQLAQSQPEALGAIFYHGGERVSAFGDKWPASVALQMHVTESDPWIEFDVVQDLARDAPDSELFVYPGEAHLVADASLPDYDPTIAGLILERSIRFLDRFA